MSGRGRHRSRSRGRPAPRKPPPPPPARGGGDNQQRQQKPQQRPRTPPRERSRSPLRKPIPHRGGRLAQEVRDRIRFLNTKGGFDNKIKVEEFEECVEQVDTETMLHILKSLEDMNWKQGVRNPAAWIGTALKRKVEDASRDQGHSADRDRSAVVDGSAIDTLIKKGVGWLNSDGGFKNTIIYREVRDAAAGLAHEDLKDIFDRMRHAGDDIRNPTSWLVSRMKQRAGSKRSGDWHCPKCAYMNFASNEYCKNCGESKPDGGASQDGSASSKSSADSVIRKGVEWLNRKGGLSQTIEVEGVLKAASGLTSEDVKGLFDDLWSKRNEVKNPTHWLCSAMRRTASGEGPPASGTGRQASWNEANVSRKPGDWDCTACGKLNFARRDECFSCGASKPDDGGTSRSDATAGANSDVAEYVRKRVSFLNEDDGFDGKLNGEAIAEKAWILPKKDVTKILNSLEETNQKKFAENKTYLENPTNWVLVAMKKVATHLGKARQWAATKSTPARLAGDWDCPACGKMNFARRDNCFSCGASRPDDAAGEEELVEDEQEASLVDDAAGEPDGDDGLSGLDPEVLGRIACLNDSGLLGSRIDARKIEEVMAELEEKSEQDMLREKLLKLIDDLEDANFKKQVANPTFFILKGLRANVSKAQPTSKPAVKNEKELPPPPRPKPALRNEKELPPPPRPTPAPKNGKDLPPQDDDTDDKENEADNEYERERERRLRSESRSMPRGSRSRSPAEDPRARSRSRSPPAEEVEEPPAPRADEVLGDNRVADRIAELNRETLFNGQLSAEKIAEATTSLISEDDVLHALDQLEGINSREKIKQPTGFVVTTLKRKADLRATNANSGSRGFDQEVSDRIKFLNSESGFAEDIDIARIEEEAGHSDKHYVMEVLTSLEEAHKKRKIASPTGWTIKALRKKVTDSNEKGADSRNSQRQDKRGKGDSSRGHYDTAKGARPSDERDRIRAALRRGVDWLNTDGGYNGGIRLDDIEKAAVGVSTTDISNIFDAMLEKGARDPTAWLVKAFRNISQKRATSSGDSNRHR